MTPKHQRFVDEYLIDLNATQAAIRAGYSAKTAEQQGPRLLGNVKVAAAVAEGQRKSAERCAVTVDSVSGMYVEAYDMAKLEKQTAVMVSAATGLGKLHGLITDKSQVKLGVDGSVAALMAAVAGKTRGLPG